MNRSLVPDPGLGSSGLGWELLAGDRADEEILELALGLALTAMLGREGGGSVSPAQFNDDLLAARMLGDP